MKTQYKEMPEIFQEFSEKRREGFIKAKEFKDKGNVLVGSYCTFMPQEIPLAMGAGTVSLCSTSEEMISEAEKDLPVNLCPLIKSSYGFGKGDKCPYFYFSDLVIGETTCDGKKKMYELMSDFKPVHIMNLPNNPTTPEAKAMYKAEIIKLKEELEKRFEVKITEDDVREGIKLRNEERRALKDIYELMKLEPLAMTGYDMFKVIYGSTFSFDKRKSIDDLKAFRERLLDEYKNGAKLDKKPRIILTGCPVGGATEKVIKAIEDNGAHVVYYENCTGGKSTELLVDEENPDVYDALAEKYLKIGCSCMSPNENRMEMLTEKIKEYKADGVIDMVLQACTPYAIETFTVRNLCRKNNVPYKNIETDYSKSDLGQLSTRISAFIEML